jgi:hypothetical protein
MLPVAGSLEAEGMQSLRFQATGRQHLQLKMGEIIARNVLS